MEELTPDDIFADHEAYKKMRKVWVDGVCASSGPQSLAASVCSFERELKRSKMLDGWEEVRGSWLVDLAALSTHSVLFYLVKQLRVYLGRQKPKPGKLAAIFAGPMRMTRSQAKLSSGHTAGRSKRRLIEEGEEEEEEEEEESSGADDAADARRLRARRRTAAADAVDPRLAERELRREAVCPPLGPG